MTLSIPEPVGVNFTLLPAGSAGKILCQVRLSEDLGSLPTELLSCPFRTSPLSAPEPCPQPLPLPETHQDHRDPLAFPKHPQRAPLLRTLAAPSLCCQNLASVPRAGLNLGDQVLGEVERALLPRLAKGAPVG